MLPISPGTPSMSLRAWRAVSGRVDVLPSANHVAHCVKVSLRPLPGPSSGTDERLQPRMIAPRAGVVAFPSGDGLPDE